MAGEGFAQTLAAARAGADWAWVSLYDALAPAVLGYLRGQRADDPEDLTGEALLQVVRDLYRFAGGEREFRAWVFVIAHHRLLDERRRRARRPLEQGLDRSTDEECSPAAEDEVLEAVTTDGVRRLIERLSPEQRDVLLLRVLGDLTVAEVARALGKSKGAVKALQRRGLETVARSFLRDDVTLLGIPALSRTQWDVSRD